YFVKADGLAQGTYIRLGSMTVKASPEIIHELQNQSRGINYEALAVYNATRDDLDPEKIKTFIKSRKGILRLSKTTDELLKSYHLITHEHTRTYPTVAGILLFGKNPQRILPQAYTICTQFSGHVGREGILASKDCEGTLIEQFEGVYAWLWEVLNKSS